MSKFSYSEHIISESICKQCYCLHNSVCLFAIFYCHFY
nr:MAG TPA: hypothetical protein [Caudoviricetes sp.]